MRYFIFIALILLTPNIGLAKASSPGSYFVITDTLNVRLAPTSEGKITNRLHRQQRVDVFELRDGWARVSKFYDGRGEGISGKVARWVAASHLSKQRPADLPQPKLRKDPRISGLPEVGQGGLTNADVLALHKGAKRLLDSGRCKQIEYGDKSASKPNTYFVNCGGPKNHYFSPTDL